MKKAKPKAKKRKPKANLTKAEANNVVQSAAPQHVRVGYAKLNGIASFGDTLIGAGHVDLSIRLAAEQIVHLVEAWRYFSGAINAYLRHSNGTAIHQAYYAELRATFSLFAGSGIQINDYRNLYVNNKNKPVEFPGHTHPATWTLWEEWIGTSTAQDILRTQVSIMPNVSLGAFEAHIGAQLATVGALKRWGYDLLQLRNDYRERNIRSYKPYWTEEPLTKMAMSDVDFVKSIWAMLLPKTHGRWGFDVAYIVYLVDRWLEESRAADPKFSVKKEYLRLIREVASKTGTDSRHIHLALTQEPLDSSLFTLAADKKGAPKNVLSRALFLLRVATLALKSNLDKFDPPKMSGSKWIRNWLHHAGLWSLPTVIAAQDMHVDYREMLDQFAPGVDLPYTIWDAADGKNTVIGSRLSRPDACLVWGIYQ